MSDQGDDRRRDLEAFANAGAQPNQPTPGGHALVRPTSGISERIIGAQPVARERDEAKIFNKLVTLAAAAGSDWFYRFPVKKKDGGQDWIEGPSIKLALNVARIFGNFSVETREIDVGDAWVFYARGTDIETGFSLERAFRQRKSQGSMRAQADRQLDIAYQIGQSKAIRNVIVNSLEIYCDYAFEEARNSLVDKIGSDLDGWRERTVQRLKAMAIELPRVERVIGRATKDWLAPDIAQVIAMGKSIADGMASSDEVFPPIEESAKGGAARATEEPPKVGQGEPQGSKAAPQSEAVAGAATQSESASGPAASLEMLQLLTIAWQRGQEGKTAGVSRKAVPPEYRADTRAREGLAWLSGWDGQPKPVA